MLCHRMLGPSSVTILPICNIPNSINTQNYNNFTKINQTERKKTCLLKMGYLSFWCRN
ncbi:hypothetical protein Hanom_Chr16g01498351 [Helianthus anomalus]